MQLDEVAPGVWRSGTRFVNWYLVDAGPADAPGGGLTVVDAGLPGYRGQLATVLRRLRRGPDEIAAVVLTHGHIDHAGAAHAFRATAGTPVPVHLHPDDVRLARDPRTNTSDRPAVRYLAWPGTAAFVGHALWQGASRARPMPETVPLVDGTELDVPGRPRVVHVPGHTAGSCVLDFRQHGVAIVGDLLCTVDAFSGRNADPQLQTRGSNADSDLAYASLERLGGVEARTVLPGHGGPWRDGVEAAVASARRIGCR